MSATLTQILILNWNNGADTVVCVKSILQYSDARVTILDNNSTDDSIELIRSGLSGDGLVVITTGETSKIRNTNDRLVLILSPQNTGFAGGNNFLMKLYISDEQVRYFWLLNNDAVATPGTLAAMKAKMEEDSRNAFTGSLILDFFEKDKVQCCGLHYYKYFGVSKMLLKNELWTETSRSNLPYGKIGFQHGASLFVRKEALATIGLMDENFFLYFEEHDWQERAAKKGLKNNIAIDAIVYHKGSVSTSSRKHLFFYYYNRSSMIFARKHNSFFVLLCSVFLLSGITVVRTKLNAKSLSWGIKGLAEGLFKKIT